MNKSATTLLENIDKVLNSVEAEMLPEREYEQVKSLQTDAIAACDKSEIEEARRIAELIFEIIESYDSKIGHD